MLIIKQMQIKIMLIVWIENEIKKINIINIIK